jgi:hypothetical protein
MHREHLAARLGRSTDISQIVEEIDAVTHCQSEQVHRINKNYLDIVKPGDVSDPLVTTLKEAQTTFANSPPNQNGLSTR